MLHVEEDREAEIVAVGRENRVNMLEELNDSLIMKENMHRSVKERKKVTVQV